MLQCLKFPFSVTLINFILMCGMPLQSKKIDAARGLAYLLNANLTLSGGCPNPPLDPSFARQVCTVQS